jgi:hypothetical protein
MNRYLYKGVLEELEKAQREKYEMDALVAQYGGISAVEPSLRDQATGYLADGLQAAGLYDNNPRAAARTAGALTGVMDFLPGTGEALAAADAANEFEQGNVGMGVLYAAGALPLVPAAATKAAGTAIKKANAARKGSGRAKNRVGTTGQYVGAPAGVDSPQALAKIRKEYEEAAVTGAPGRDWYSDSSEWIEEVAAPGREQPVADALGITSAGTGVDTNLGFTVKGVNQMATGLPVDTGRFPNSMGPLLIETAAGNRSHLGPKRQPFADNLSVSWNPEMAHTPVHDIWDGRAWGYVGPNGKPWDAGFSPAQHSFMDDQAQFVIDRMNKNNAGGFNDWNGLNSQAAAWTGAKIKAGDLSPEDAAKHYGDFSTKYQASGTHEQIPGVGTGHLEGMADLPYADREAYTRSASWRNEKGQDRLYSDAGMLVEPTLDGVGAYTPSSGVLEINPLEVARPLVTTADGAVRANEKQLLDIAESSRAYVDAQNAGAWNKVIPESQTKAGDRSSLLVPIEGGPSADQMGALSELAGNNGMFVIDNGDGVLRMANDVYSDIGAERTGTTLGKELKKGELKDGLDELGLEAERAKIELGYEDYEEAWQAGEGSEVATKQFLERLDENPEYAARIEGALMDKAAANLERDAAIAVEKGLATRQDIQTARKLLSEGGLQALRDAIGKGILPAALLGIVLNLPEQNDSERGVLSA